MKMRKLDAPERVPDEARIALEKFYADNPGIILCGPHQPTIKDLEAVAEFAAFLNDRKE
jgi:hypothetical protein